MQATARRLSIVSATSCAHRLKMKITRFNRLHAHRCMEIFLTNQGKFFDPSEMAMLRSFLENEKLTEEFYVIAEDEDVIGCGGFELTGQGQVDLTWGMVHQNFHGRGYGKALLEFRLHRIEQLFGKVVIRVETSQHTKGFFEKYGFETQATKADGFGPDIDYVLLTRDDEPNPTLTH